MDRPPLLLKGLHEGPKTRLQATEDLSFDFLPGSPAVSTMSLPTFPSYGMRFNHSNTNVINGKRAPARARFTLCLVCGILCEPVGAGLAFARLFPLAHGVKEWGNHNGHPYRLCTNPIIWRATRRCDRDKLQKRGKLQCGRCPVGGTTQVIFRLGNLAPLISWVTWNVLCRS